MSADIVLHRSLKVVIAVTIAHYKVYSNHSLEDIQQVASKALESVSTSRVSHVVAYWVGSDYAADGKIAINVHGVHWPSWCTTYGNEFSNGLFAQLSGLQLSTVTCR